jgi:hypothetical protein
MDDLVITGSNDGMRNALKANLKKTFDMNDHGRLIFFLGCIWQLDDGIFLSI